MSLTSPSATRCRCAGSFGLDLESRAARAAWPSGADRIRVEHTPGAFSDVSSFPAAGSKPRTATVLSVSTPARSCSPELPCSASPTSQRQNTANGLKCGVHMARGLWISGDCPIGSRGMFGMRALTGSVFLSRERGESGSSWGPRCAWQPPISSSWDRARSDGQTPARAAPQLRPRRQRLRSPTYQEQARSARGSPERRRAERVQPSSPISRPLGSIMNMAPATKGPQRHEGIRSIPGSGDPANENENSSGKRGRPSF